MQFWMDSYRGISLFTHFNKVNEILLWGRISEWWVKERRISTYRALIKRGSLVSTQFPCYKSQYCTPGEAPQSFPVTRANIVRLEKHPRVSLLQEPIVYAWRSTPEFPCYKSQYCTPGEAPQSFPVTRANIVRLEKHPRVSLLQEPILYAWRSTPEFPCYKSQ